MSGHTSLCALSLLFVWLRIACVLCLSLAKLDASSGTGWLRDGGFAAGPLWLSGLGPLMPSTMRPLAFNQSKPHANLYSSGLAQAPTWSQSTESEADQLSAKSATLADVDYPKSASNRYVPVISTRVISKRNPLIPTNNIRVTHSGPDSFFSDLDDFFSKPIGTPMANAAGSISEPARPASSGEQLVDANLEDMFKMDQLENMFDLDLF